MLLDHNEKEKLLFYYKTSSFTVAIKKRLFRKFTQDRLESHRDSSEGLFYFSLQNENCSNLGFNKQKSVMLIGYNYFATLLYYTIKLLNHQDDKSLFTFVELFLLSWLNNRHLFRTPLTFRIIISHFILIGRVYFSSVRTSKYPERRFKTWKCKATSAIWKRIKVS